MTGPEPRYDDPGSNAAAVELLRRHKVQEAEANITSAIRNFFIATSLDMAQAGASAATGAAIHLAAQRRPGATVSPRPSSAASYERAAHLQRGKGRGECRDQAVGRRRKLSRERRGSSKTLFENSDAQDTAWRMAVLLRLVKSK